MKASRVVGSSGEAMKERDAELDDGRISTGEPVAPNRVGVL
jgi:hypothetical protein